MSDWGVGARTLAQDGADLAAPRPQSDSSGGAARAGVPAWAKDARWYEIIVSRFANGDAANDPDGTLPWLAEWPDEEPLSPGDMEKLSSFQYGGDLQGVKQRLPYLQELGVNTIFLRLVFAGSSEQERHFLGMRHVRDDFGVKGALARISGETADPATWQFTDSDKVLLELIGNAHDRGMRVVLEAVFGAVGSEFWAWQDVVTNGKGSKFAEWFDVAEWGPPAKGRGPQGDDGRMISFKFNERGYAPEVEAHIFAAVKRWIDPDGDGKGDEGIDGLVVYDAQRVPRPFWQRFREQVKKIDPDVLLVADVRGGDPAAWVKGDGFDTAFNYAAGAAITRYFSGAEEEYTLSKFSDDLLKAGREWPADARLAAPLPLTDRSGARLLTLMGDASGASAIASTPSAPGFFTDEAVDRWRLAQMFAFSAVGVPHVLYGDEVGQFGHEAEYADGPMWWADAKPPAVRPKYLRMDFHDLIQMFCRQRDMHEAWRQGEAKLVHVDDKLGVLAIAREVPGRQVVTVVHTAGGRKKLPLKLGRPGQVLGVLSPNPRPLKGKGGLQLGGSRQYVGIDGVAVLALDPMSMRIVLVWDEMPDPGQLLREGAGK